MVDLVKPSRQFTCCINSPSLSLNREHNGTVFTVYNQHTSALKRQPRQGNISYKYNNYICAFWNKGQVFKKKEAKKRVEGKNTVQKLSPSLCIIHSSVLQVSVDMLNSGLTEQQTGQAFSLLSHLLSHFPSHHWSWRMPALVSSPRRIVTYGNAFGREENSGQNFNTSIRMCSIHTISDI